MTLNTVTVTWNVEDIGLEPLGGTVSFQLSALVADSADGTVVALGAPAAYNFAGGTGTSAPLIANDNPGLVPSGTYYRVKLVTGPQNYEFDAQLDFASGATQTLAFLAANPAQPVAQYAQYLPLPTGTPAAGQVPVFTGSGYATVPGSSTPTLTETATLYVTADGSDSNSGLSWTSGFATISHAIAQLPAVNGYQVGTVEVGYGTFAPFAVSATQAPLVRGRGQGVPYSPPGVTTVAAPTTIANSGTGVGIAITGTNGDLFAQVTDMLVTGNASDSGGVVITSGGYQQLARVTIDSCGGGGLGLVTYLGGTFDQVYVSRCGLASATGVGGGLVGTGLQYQITFKNSSFVNNNGWNAHFAGGRAVNFQGCLFQEAAVSSASGSGTGIYAGGSVTDGFYNFTDCWFEKNALNGMQHAGAMAKFTDCTFAGDNVSRYAIVNGSFAVTVEGCLFLQHTGTHSIDSPNGNVTYLPCTCLDAAFILGPGGTVPSAQTSASSFGQVGGVLSGCLFPQTLGSAGAVTFYPGFANTQVITLNANAASSSIDTSSSGYPGIPGEEMTIVWVQGSAGSKTYTWPSNCKFAAGTAPTASTTAGYKDAVKFWFDGTNWNEISRSVGVH